MAKITEPNNFSSDAVADLEEMGCGDLTIALMKAMKPLKTDQVLKVHALDPGAQADIPACCNMRGHELLAWPCGEDNSCYYIKRDSNLFTAENAEVVRSQEIEKMRG